MPYRISYIDTSMSTDKQLRREELPTDPAALPRARELLEDVSCVRRRLLKDSPNLRDSDEDLGQPIRR